MICATAAALLLLSRLPGTNTPSVAGEPRKLLHAGVWRSYLLHLPSGQELRPSLPLVMVLHGGGGTGSAVAGLTRFSALSDSEGFVVVYPEAVNRHWNDGRRVRRFRSYREGVDDVGFAAALIDTLARELRIDRRRVYATGVSNGGMMCYRLGCELADRIAAIAPVAAAMPESLVDCCLPASPVSVLAINGTGDPLVPFEGGGVGLGAKRGNVASVLRSIGFWVRADGCRAPAETVMIEDRDPGDGMRTKRFGYADGMSGSEVVLYIIEGGGHTWPSGARRPLSFGRSTSDIDATVLIWDFFRRHKR